MLLERQKQIAKSMRDMTSKAASVFDINLRGCIQNDEDAERIFLAFTANKTVASLNLQHNPLTGRSLAKLMNAIKGNTALSSLNLAASIKTPEAAAALAAGTMTSTSYWTKSRAFLSSAPPVTRRVPCSALCPR